MVWAMEMKGRQAVCLISTDTTRLGDYRWSVCIRVPLASFQIYNGKTESDLILPEYIWLKAALSLRLLIMLVVLILSVPCKFALTKTSWQGWVKF